MRKNILISSFCLALLASIQVSLAGTCTPTATESTDCTFDIYNGTGNFTNINPYKSFKAADFLNISKTLDENFGHLYWKEEGPTSDLDIVLRGGKYDIKKVGIGATSPSAKLHIKGDSGIDSFYIQNNADDFLIKAKDNGDIEMDDTGDTFFIDASQNNIGIGTITPNSNFKLELSGTTTKDKKIGINDTQVLYLPDQTAYSGSLFLGDEGASLSTGATQNTVVGINAGVISTGAKNTFLGHSAGATMVTTGDENVAVGYQAGIGLQASNENTIVGARSGNFNSDGDQNIIVGYDSGGNIETSKNILIGNGLLAQSNSETDQLSIGNLIFGKGGFGVGAAVGSGTIGIGEEDPDAKLHIKSNGTAGDKAFQVDNGATTPVNLMVIEDNGDVGIGDHTPDARLNVKGATTASGTDPLFLLQGGGASGEQSMLVLDNGLVGIGPLGATSHTLTVSANAANNPLWVKNGNIDPIMVVNGDGNVGIGTSIPAQALEVNGVVRLQLDSTPDDTQVCIDPDGDLTSCSDTNSEPWKLTDHDADGATDEMVHIDNTDVIKIGLNNEQLIYRPDQSAYSGSLFLGDGGDILSTGATQNTAVGINAGLISTGAKNTFLGHSAGATMVTTGDENVAVGYQAGIGLQASNENTIVGARSGNFNSDGDQNIIVGYDSGGNIETSKNILIGNNISAQSNNETDQLSIGNLIFAKGGFGTGTTVGTGNVGIAAPDPTETLDIDGTTRVRDLAPEDSSNDRIYPSHLVGANSTGVLTSDVYLCTRKQRICQELADQNMDQTLGYTNAACDGAFPNASCTTTILIPCPTGWSPLLDVVVDMDIRFPTSETQQTQYDDDVRCKHL